jgi:O-antigen ligase
MLNQGPLAAILYKESVSIRGYYWKAALKMFFAHPFTGVGVDNYGDYFKQFRAPEYSNTYGFSIGSTSAHNVVLQFFATGGILLLILNFCDFFYV